MIFVATLKRFFIANKQNLVICFFLYLLGCASLILANFNYVDDLDRSITGLYGFNVWSRYSASVLSGILSLNSQFLLTLFPYSLFVALVFLTLSSIMLISIIDKRLLKSKCAILISLCVGLSPYYLENLSYKFDAPFMALGLLSSIAPFLFLRLPKLFVIISSFLLFVMLTSYQASSGVYIMLLFFVAFRFVLQKDYYKATKIIALGFVSYCIAGIAFSIVHTPLGTYANNNILPMQYMLLGIYKHILQYFSVIYDDFGFNSVMINLIFGFGLIFVFKSIKDAKIGKVIAFLSSVGMLFLLAIASFGLYIFIIMPIMLPRAFIGFGVLVAILGLYALSFDTKILKNISIALSLFLAQYLVTFANYYGESLKMHDDYQRFRFTLVMNDLGHFLDNSSLNTHSQFNIATHGNAGFSPNIIYSMQYYPIIKRLLPITQSEWVWSLVALRHYGIFAMNTTKECKSPPPIQEILVDSYYHTITRFVRDTQICYTITYKNITRHFTFSAR